MNAKGKKKQDGKKNYLGLKMIKISSRILEDQRAPKDVVMWGKQNHYPRDYKHNKSQNEANVVQAGDNTIAIVSEIMAIKGKVQRWWYDICATVHISYDKKKFKTYYEVTDWQNSTSLMGKKLLLLMYFMFST